MENKYAHSTPKEVRELIRKGTITSSTSGMVFHSPCFALSAARRPHPARGRKMTKAFFFELIKIKPEI
jgi:hypothetical protein